MIKDIFRRVTAGALSVLTLFTTVPFSGAADGGIIPLAEEDNEASSIEINVGEVYTIADRGACKRRGSSRTARRATSGLCSRKRQTVRRSAHTAQTTARATPARAVCRIPSPAAYRICMCTEWPCAVIRACRLMNSFPRWAAPLRMKTLQRICISVRRRRPCGRRWEMRRSRLTAATA